MISSPENEKVKFVRSLYAKKKRYEERAFIVEGLRLVEEALEAGAKPRIILYQPDILGHTPRGDELMKRLGPDALPVTERVLRSISDTVAPQGVVAVVPIPVETAGVTGALALVLDGLRDPGNLGTILRTAVAAGVESIITTGDTADPFNPKVVRAGMGAHFRLSLLLDKSWMEIGSLLTGRAVYLATAHGGKAYYDIDWTRPSALIVGSEAHGASEEADRFGAERVTIPMAPGIESLNAAVATGVILLEAFRQHINSITEKG